MIKLNLNKTVTAKAAPRLPIGQYKALAEWLIENHSTDDVVSKEQFDALKKQISAYVDGELTKAGYSVYVRYLMGAISAASPKLADALAAEVIRKEYF